MCLSLATLAAGCAHGGDREAACRLAQLERDHLYARSALELAQIARGSPFQERALSGYAQQVSAATLGGLAAATIVAGLVVALATNPGVSTDARNAAYGLGGAALGLTAATVVLGLTSHHTVEGVRGDLRVWADRCQ